ncbi:uncharacterized protein LOC113863729 [Abrus precatorius]|uniref:Uncharacterized protein LOC113863729 n=1 Tax=Abrus precatorius TaxID=3816 RepID=A0A8B8LD38_ABRPR|nr:uncharacterized protein LOC113863729 [Abrus precatorius]
MGQSLQKLAPGTDEKKLKELEQIVEKFYEDYVKEANTFVDFYRAVCEIVEELNHRLGNTQITLPKIDNLQREFDDNHRGKGRALTKSEFQDIMKNLVKDSGFTGIGAKETLLCIFGVPLATLFIKDRVMPQAIPNEFFIPGITSLTVFTLAALNKI